MPTRWSIFPLSQRIGARGEVRTQPAHCTTSVHDPRLLARCRRGRRLQQRRCPASRCATGSTRHAHPEAARVAEMLTAAASRELKAARRRAGADQARQRPGAAVRRRRLAGGRRDLSSATRSKNWSTGSKRRRSTTCSRSTTSRSRSTLDARIADRAERRYTCTRTPRERQRRRAGRTTAPPQDLGQGQEPTPFEGVIVARAQRWQGIRCSYRAADLRRRRPPAGGRRRRAAPEEHVVSVQAAGGGGRTSATISSRYKLHRRRGGRQGQIQTEIASRYALRRRAVVKLRRQPSADLERAGTGTGSPPAASR